MGRSRKNEPGAFCEAITVKTTGSAPDPAVYEAFLAACRPVRGHALKWLTKDKGVTPDVITHLGLRLCGSEYMDIMNNLGLHFGEAALLAAGLVKQRSRDSSPILSFLHYYALKAAFLVIPYIKDGRPVYLKARPPISKDEAERRGLVRFLNTGGTIPCLYNVDVLKGQPDKVLICEGESDTWTALSYGYAAVGTPGARNFKAAWVEGFRGLQDTAGRSRVYLVLDADKASLVIADLFLKAGLPVPLQLILPLGKDLTECMKEGSNDG